MVVITKEVPLRQTHEIENSAINENFHEIFAKAQAISHTVLDTAPNKKQMKEGQILLYRNTTDGNERMYIKINDTIFRINLKESRVRAHLSADQGSIGTGAWVKVNLDVDSGTYGYDANGDFNTTDKKFTVPCTGDYQVNYQVRFDNIGDGKIGLSALFNAGGNALTEFKTTTGVDDEFCVGGSDILKLAKGVTLELYAFHNKGSNTTVRKGTYGQDTFMSISLLK